MSGQTIQTRPPTAEELQRLDDTKADFTAMAGETCGQCYKPMTLGQPFHAIGAVRRIYVCATCALDHMRSGT